MRVSGRVSVEGWLTLLLLASYQLVLFRSVAAAGWGERIEATPFLAAAGVLIGAITARSHLRMPWSVGAGALFGAELILLVQATISPGQSWAEKVTWTVTGLVGWVGRMVGSGLVYDVVGFSLVMSSLAYGLGFCSSWLLFRYQRAWAMLVLTGAFGLVHLSYATVDSIPPYFLALLVGALTVASCDLDQRRARWRAAGVPILATPYWTILTAGGIVSTALLVAPALPAGSSQPLLASAYQRVTEPFSGMGRQINRLFGDGARGFGPAGGPLAFASTVFPRESFELSDRPLLRVEASERLYWHAIVYDRYDGHSISTSEGTETRTPSDVQLPLDPLAAERRRFLTQRVTVLSGQLGSVVAAGDPLRFDIETIVEHRDPAWDVIGVRAAAPLGEGQTYTAVSAVRQPAIDELVKADAEYPAWLERYLQLPGDLPPRVGELAARVAGGGSVFERAAALEAYLRGFTYSTHTTPPPPDRDWVDFVLFDTQAGYCDYLATAMMVMLRTQGIPARVVSGFAPGDYDEAAHAWIVHERDTHSWPEAYVPGIGWVPFEPSAARQPLARPASRAESEARAEREASARTDLAPWLEPPPDELLGAARSPSGGVGPGRSAVAELLALLAVGLLLLGAALAAIDYGWNRALRGYPPIARRFGAVQRLAALAGWTSAPAHTPYEAARALGSALPEARPALEQLTELYVEETYRGRASAQAVAAAEDAWQLLRRALLVRAVRRWLTRRSGWR